MFYRFLDTGGPVMWPLLVCSIALIAFLLERAITLGLRKSLGSRLTYRHLQAHRKVLPFFVDVPPALGLLGTVVGLVQSFALLDGAPDASGVAGLATACITTIFGLIIALIASCANYLLEAFVPPSAPVTPTHPASHKTPATRNPEPTPRPVPKPTTMPAAKAAPARAPIAPPAPSPTPA